MAVVRSSNSPNFCPLSSNAILARASSQTIPDAAPLTPSIPPGPGICWARLLDAFPEADSPTDHIKKKTNYVCIPFRELATHRQNYILGEMKQYTL